MFTGSVTPGTLTEYSWYSSTGPAKPTDLKYESIPWKSTMPSPPGTISGVHGARGGASAGGRPPRRPAPIARAAVDVPLFTHRKSLTDKP